MWAARNGHATVVELLLDAKADTALCDQVRVSFQAMLTKACITHCVVTAGLQDGS
jgi:ankyrin repeat protein